MAIKHFGYTWWGQAWLNALKDIDFSNRLPRGMRYARNDLVKSIAIKGNIVEARVKGRKRSPYEVKIAVPRFSESKKNRILKIINSNFYYLARLSARELPSEMLEDLEKNNIKLFPAKWEDLDAHCSCPDWAVPCKHIAAVIYMIANEIDKKPFLVFNLHDFDILSNFERESKSEIGLKSISEIVKLDDKKEKVKQTIDAMDFSTIPALKKELFSVLAPKPLFHLTKDFKKHLLKAYDNTGKEIIQFLEQDFEVPEKLADLKRISLKLDKNLSDFKGIIKFKQDRVNFSRDNLLELLKILNKISLNEVFNFHESVVIFTLFYSFAAKLAQQGAFIPEVIKLTEKLYILRYIPALFNEKISQIFEQLRGLIPPDFITVNKTHMSVNEQALVLTSLFLGYFVGEFQKKKEPGEDKTADFFFNRVPFKIDKFEESEIPQTIHLWLSKFYIVHKNYTPLIQVYEPRRGDKDFGIEIKIEDSKNVLSEPIALKKIVNDEKFKEIRLDILKDLSLLSTYFPVVNEYLGLKKANRLKVPPTNFVQLWFNALPILKLLGIRTLIPKSLQEIFAPGLTLSVKSKFTGSPAVVSYLNMREMLDFDWSIAVGSDVISAEEFRESVKGVSGVVKIKNKYVRIDKKEINKILKSLEQKPRLSPLDILKINLEGKFNGAPIRSDKKVADIFDKLFELKETAVPASLNGELREYQQRGFNWLYNNTGNGLGSLIADDMGLGKTIQVLTLLLKLQEEKHLTADKRALIVVPATLMSNWRKEFEKFAPGIKTFIYHGLDRSLKIRDVEVIITTYGMVRSERAKFAKEEWLAVIIDEAQNIKNPTANQTAAVKSLRAGIKIAMTGTPVENRLSEYWSIMDFVFEDYLGSLTAFKENYAIPIERFRDSESLRNFKKLTAPFVLRRVKTDRSIIDDLPEKIETDRYCNLTKEQASLYEKVVRDIEAVLDNGDDRSEFEKSGIIFKLMTYLKQVCNHPAQFLKKPAADVELSGKSKMLMDLLEKIYLNDEKVLIFTQYKEMGELLKEMVTRELDEEVLFLHGGVAVKKRGEMVDLFQEDRVYRTFILSLKAGGTGLNLTAANNVIHYDLWWNPAVENQATDRAFRIGQEKNVIVNRFISKGTFEEKIDEIIKSKKELSDLTVGSGEKWITEFSNAELRELIRLESENI
ncbi:MAG: SWIM zinc finger family protein [Candidatus Aminicenantes bacterium]|nr:SWIM zinc finger family protein [Candidatus Aminicenantes bacterium]